MTDPGPLRLCKDPHLPWPGPFPYDQVGARLRAGGHPGLGPAAPAAEVFGARFALMRRGELTEEDRQGMSELQSVGRRLVVDFFLYQLSASVAATEAEGEPIPDLGPLADGAPELAAALRPSTRFDPGPPPRPVPVDPARLEPPPVDVGPLGCDEAAVLGGG